MTRPALILLVAVTMAASSPALAQAPAAGTAVKILPDWSYQPLFDRAASVEKLFRESRVIDRGGKAIGSVENVIFSDSGEALAIIASIDGVSGRSETHVSIPWSEIQFSDEWEDVNVPIDADNVTEFTGFDPSGILEKRDTASVGTVEGGDAMDLGEDVFQARDLIGDHAYLGDNYRWGYINDLVIRDGRLVAIVVEVADGSGSRHYAAPFDETAGVDPGARRYNPPLNENAIETLGEFDYDRFRKRH